MGVADRLPKLVPVFASRRPEETGASVYAAHTVKRPPLLSRVSIFVEQVLLWYISMALLIRVPASEHARKFGLSRMSSAAPKLGRSAICAIIPSLKGR